MVHIAIAGGTGGLGRTLVEELMQSGEHQIFVLSRKPDLPFAVESNVHCLATLYDNIDSVVKLLDANNINTLISTVNPPTPEVHNAQITLIRAASKSQTVRRFVPSEWGVDYFHDDEHLPLPWKVFKQETIKELEKHPNLEYTSFYNGFFMDYFGMPHAASHMLAEIPYIDIEAGRAAIPGSGDEKVVLTHTRDVARFVRKAIESTEAWPRHSIIVGDTTTLNQILRTAEKARNTKFEVVYDSLEDLRQGKITEIPAYQKLYPVFPKDQLLSMMAGFGIGMITGVSDLGGPTLNDKYPDVKPMKMVDFVEEHWTGR